MWVHTRCHALAAFMVNLNNRDAAMPAPAISSTPEPRSSLAYRLAIAALLVALLAIGAAYGLSALLTHLTNEREDPALSATHLVTIGAQHYVMPAALLTDAAQRKDGFAERLDMRVALPLAENTTLLEVDIALMPRGRVRSSAQLLDSVYLHQFADAQISGPPGLVGKPLEGDAGTGGETVWYDPLSAQPFTAKCMAPIGDAPGGNTCLRVFQLEDRNT